MKKIIACVLFCAILVGSLVGLTDFLTYKGSNRYYLLEKYLEDHPEQNNYDVQVFGACHAYTSLHPQRLEETAGVSTFLYANPGEIMPITYLRMIEQFKKHTPKVAVVETWGINAYDTYDDAGDILGAYLICNLERIPFSLEKQEVIEDFASEDAAAIHFPLANYKERLADGSLSILDFDYSFAEFQHQSHRLIAAEMESRLTRNGFKLNPSIAITDYPQKQSVIGEEDFAEIHPTVLKYLQKIVELCREKGVKLIFYRSPYTSTVGELGRVKHMQQFCQDNDVPFFDLEAELAFDYETDFYDYQHLSETGANKATDFLAPHILKALE